MGEFYSFAGSGRWLLCLQVITWRTALDMSDHDGDNRIGPIGNSVRIDAD